MLTLKLLTEYLPEVLGKVALSFLEPNEEEYAKIGFCEKAINLCMITQDFNTVFTGSCAGGNIELAEIMVKNGATAWKSGLLYACREGQLEMVKWVLSNGDYFVYVEQGTKFDLNKALVEACYSGNVILVKYLQNRGADNWMSGFHMACEKGHTELVKHLSSDNNDHGLYGFNFIDNDEHGLYLACFHGHFDIVKLLVINGKIRKGGANIALATAITKGHFDIASCMSLHYKFTLYDFNIILSSACRNNYPETIRWLVDKMGAYECLNCGRDHK
jgi:hypothetical protein